MKDEWANTWHDLICESEQLIEAIGEGGSECFTQSELMSMNIKAIHLEKQAEAIAKAWKRNRADEIRRVAIERDKTINPIKTEIKL